MPRILLRRSTAADWSTTNPILSDGEPAFEHDTGRMKVGDGVTAWSALAYTGGSGGGGPIASTDITDATTVGKAVLTATDAPTARAAIGAGTSSLALGTTSTTALAGNTAPTDIGAATAAQGAKADTAVQPAALTSLAPLASPALTGTPTAPTATAGTNSTQLANTAFVAAAIAALINSAPGALDTLKELADAIGDDANYAATVTNALALKAPLVSPTFTGTVAGITKAMVGLGSVDNTADSAKPVSTAQQAALDLKANSADLADVALSGSYLDLANKPSAVDVGATPQTLVSGATAVTIGGSVDALPGTVTNGVVVFLTGS